MILEPEEGDDEKHAAAGLNFTYVVNKCGYKIGFIGIIERDWVETFKDLEVDLKYLNYKRRATFLAK